MKSEQCLKPGHRMVLGSCELFSCSTDTSRLRGLPEHPQQVLGELGCPKLLHQGSEPRLLGTHQALIPSCSCVMGHVLDTFCQDPGPTLGSFLITAVSPSQDHPLVHSASSDHAVTWL